MLNRAEQARNRLFLTNDNFAKTGRSRQPRYRARKLADGNAAGVDVGEPFGGGAVVVVERESRCGTNRGSADDWPWSSARSHIAERRVESDPLTDVRALGVHVCNWRAMLRHGAELGDANTAAELLAEAIEARLRTGRPLAPDEWIDRQEATLGRALKPRKPGPKRKAQGGG